MAVNKNFVVKNGLEVNTQLILADASTNKVGIGSTAPRFELDVAGGIGATDSYVSGVSTIFTELNVGTDGSVLTVLGIGGSVGVGTATPEYLLDIRSPVSTGQTALYVQGDVRVSGDLQVDDINLDDASIQNLTITEALNVTTSGISTFGGFVNLTDTLSVSGISTFGGYLDINADSDFSGSVNIGGITTISNSTDSTTFNNGALIVEGGLGVQKSVNIGGNLDVTGNISIAGSFFSLQSQEVYISNKDIILGFTTEVTPNDDTANHAGIAIASTEGSPLVSFTASGINTLPDTYKQLMWFRSGTLGFSTDLFGFNYGVAIGTTEVSDGVRLAVGSDIRITDTTINTINLNVNGIVTSTSGVTTYYGDGRYLNLKNSPYAGIGIGTTGGTVGYGITFLDLKGAGVSTTQYNVSTGIATIFFEGGGGGGSISISTVAPTSPGSGDLWYSPDYGRTFIYYDETVVGYGTDAYWVDAAPFNVGTIPITGVGIQSAGVLVGTGVTILNFVGAANTFAVVGDRIDISIAGGVGIQSAGSVISDSGITQLNFVGAGNTFAVNGNTVDISISGGGGSIGTTGITTQTFFSNPNIISEAYVLDNPNHNYGMFGPVSVGATITVGVGNTFVIV
jgi:hypothetical protein